MDAYGLPWFDPAEEAEARLDALEDQRARPRSLIEGLTPLELVRAGEGAE